jgi:hypothetical protein
MVAVNWVVAKFSITTVLWLKRKNEKRRADFSGGVVDLMGWRSSYPA